MPLKSYRLRPSQNGIFILAKGKDQLISIAVEGKVDESFGELVAGWKLHDKGGKKARLKFLCDVLQLDESKIDRGYYYLVTVMDDYSRYIPGFCDYLTNQNQLVKMPIIWLCHIC